MMTDYIITKAESRYRKCHLCKDRIERGERFVMIFTGNKSVNCHIKHFSKEFIDNTS